MSKSVMNDMGNFALCSRVARRLEDIKLDKKFHEGGKAELEESWNELKARVEHALTLPAFSRGVIHESI